MLQDLRRYLRGTTATGRQEQPVDMAHWSSTGSSSSNSNKQDALRRSRESTPLESTTKTGTSSGSSSHFEYSLPMTNSTDDDDMDSNKSTPYYTPLEFFHGSFEFPSPKLEQTQLQQCNEQANETSTSGDDYMECSSNKKMNLSKQSMVKQLSASSPAVGRKTRRFSLYERRSCSPQHLLNKHCSLDVSLESEQLSHDKENTKPRYVDKIEDYNLFVASAETNSPETGSPKILAAAAEVGMLGSSRVSFSPKLLSSINKLNLSGSPLGVIGSAGYKNGNYFKFPEIDHVVQESTIFEQQKQQQQPTVDENTAATAVVTAAAAYCDNQTRTRQNKLLLARGVGNVSPGIAKTTRLKVTDTMADTEPSTMGSYSKLTSISTTISNSSNNNSSSIKSDCRKNRKNKNNLTIRIKDSPCGGMQQPPSPTQIQTPTPSPSPKPKTPTIKNTKEKALSLDSAATAVGATELTIVVQANASCNAINVAPPSMRLSSAHVSHERLQLPSSVSQRSTSLSQLSTMRLGDAYASMNLGRGTRRRIPSVTGSCDWQQQRKNESVLKKSLTDAEFDEPSPSGATVAALKSADEKLLLDASNRSSASLTPSYRSTQRHTPILHASNTNLKTLPELLTLVEFNTSSPTNKEADYSPYKQKSMDLPSATAIAATPSAHPPMIRSKHVTGTSSSTNLLQRRGSNHSLTLNLHGSCSNLVGNCRSGLSVSNYSLGSVTNSTNNLNSKSTCNLDINAAAAHPMAPAIHGMPSHGGQTLSTQGVKQSLFRRRGSNHSLTLANLTATSCGNLNSFASQQSLHVERPHMQLGGGVTRTTSFVTPTHTTTATSSVNVTPKRGLLERRGSNQSLTLHMGGSFGGIGGAERQALANSNLYLPDGGGAIAVEPPGEVVESKLTLPVLCGAQTHRKFFSSENLNRGNNQFADLNQAHKRDAKQLCFGSVSDLKPTSNYSLHDGDAQETGDSRKEQHFDFQESNVCTCTGLRNIVTRPLSPQTTSEEFKIYLANIQMLQNASNALSQLDLIKLNHIFDNSYTASGKGGVEQTLPVLSVHSASGSSSSKDLETPPGLVTTSEDWEVAQRYEQAVRALLDATQFSDDEQKRIFRDLHKEFWDLPLNHQEKPMVFGTQTKNRYKTILPNENSRVILEKECQQLADLLATELSTPPETLTIEEVPYVNANYIKGPDYTSKCYIATQGPLPNTIFEFWLMVQQNTRRHFQKTAERRRRRSGSSLELLERNQLSQYYQKIVMLTNFMENNRPKCAVYFPVELNEVLLATGSQDRTQPTVELLNYFETYLTENEDEEQQHASATPTPQTPNTLAPELSTDKPPLTAHIECHTLDLTSELREVLKANAVGNSFIVKNVGIVRKSGYTIRKLLVLYAAEATNAQQLLLQKFYCYHYWYPDWPDHRSPRDINTLVDICLHILNLGKCEFEFGTFGEQMSPRQPHLAAQPVQLYQQDIFNAVQPLPVIHCSAGIGRTGCLTAILNGVRQLRQSLAYSLTSMAAAAATKAKSEAAASDANVDTQLLSPVDFCLPKHFLDEITPLAESDVSGIGADIELFSDTDSSFTRNTLLYVHYILQENDHDRAARLQRPWQLPELQQLPKTPDIFVDILGIVCNLRLQRGGMVQNSEQYELIHRTICLYLKRTFALKRF